MTTKLIKEEKLLFGLPIHTKEFGTIYQPTLRDFFNNDIDVQSFIGLFSLKAELMTDKPNELKDFDIFLCQLTDKEQGNLLIVKLMEYIKLLYKTNEVKLNPGNLETINISIEVDENVYHINRDNYSRFADIVLIMLGVNNNIADEAIKEELSEIELEMARRRKEFERKKAERQKEQKKEEKGLTIYELINFIIHTDNSQFDYNSIQSLTVYQIRNTFNLYQQKENYKYYMDYKTSGQFKIEENFDHWFFKK